MEFDLQKLVRKNIKNMEPYSSARHEFTGSSSVYLNANENPYGSPVPESYNRYPDPLQSQLKMKLAKMNGVNAENICIGNGSDEIIDLAYRVFCSPGKDNVSICPPTYGMYGVCANINDVEIRKVDLTADFQLDTKAILRATDSNTKLLFICSPNNPTGNSMNRMDIRFLLYNFPGIVIIDEAYIHYSDQRSFIGELSAYPNLVVLQTLSKAWGLAALRIGLCYSSPEIISLFNKVKPPYNINEASQQKAIKALDNIDQVNEWIKETIGEKIQSIKELQAFSFVRRVHPSDANFMLVEVEDANSLYRFLIANKIVVRNRSRETNCENCLRISIGTPEENTLLLSALKLYRP